MLKDAAIDKTIDILMSHIDDLDSTVAWYLAERIYADTTEVAVGEERDGWIELGMRVGNDIPLDS